MSHFWVALVGMALVANSSVAANAAFEIAAPTVRFAAVEDIFSLAKTAGVLTTVSGLNREV